MSVHINANKEDIAKTVLMPGDPMRAKKITSKYLEDYKLVSDTRGIYAYTGFYKGNRITVMASGIGIPSIGIYSHELYTMYGVENIIRIGTCGTYAPNLNLYDILLVTESYSLSSYAKILGGYRKHMIKPTKDLNLIIEKSFEKLSKPLIKGRVYSTDIFYSDTNQNTMYKQKKCLAVEMESFGLFYNAKRLNKKAACILTVSDKLITGEQATSQERQNSFNEMTEIALEAAINL